jgi:hypothetical protein
VDATDIQIKQSVLDYRDIIMRYFLGAVLFGLGAFCFSHAVMSRISLFEDFTFELASVTSAVICGAVFAGLMDNTAQKTHHRMGLAAGLFLTIGSFVLGNVLLTFGSWIDRSLLETSKTILGAVFIGLTFGYWVMILALPFGALSGWCFFYLRQKNEAHYSKVRHSVGRNRYCGRYRRTCVGTIFASIDRKEAI